MSMLKPISLITNGNIQATNRILMSPYNTVQRNVVVSSVARGERSVSNNLITIKLFMAPGCWAEGLALYPQDMTGTVMPWSVSLDSDGFRSVGET